MVPTTRTEFWLNKIGRNVANNFRQQTELVTQGWIVLTVWECELRPPHREADLAALLEVITGPPEATEISK